MTSPVCVVVVLSCRTLLSALVHVSELRVLRENRKNWSSDESIPKKKRKREKERIAPCNGGLRRSLYVVAGKILGVGKRIWPHNALTVVASLAGCADKEYKYIQLPPDP